MYTANTINETGKIYTTDSVEFDDYYIPFQAREHIEYEYNGKKYIRFVGDYNCKCGKLSDGRTIQEGTAYWIEVSPIKWMIDKKTNIAFSKKIIFAGVQFNKENYDGDFENTDIYRFLNEVFANDIIPGFVNNQTKAKCRELALLQAEYKRIQAELDKLIPRKEEIEERIRQIQSAGDDIKTYVKK